MILLPLSISTPLTLQSFCPGPCRLFEPKTHYFVDQTNRRVKSKTYVMNAKQKKYLMREWLAPITRKRRGRKGTGKSYAQLSPFLFGKDKDLQALIANPFTRLLFLFPSKNKETAKICKEYKDKALKENFIMELLITSKHWRDTNSILRKLNDAFVYPLIKPFFLESNKPKEHWYKIDVDWPNINKKIEYSFRVFPSEYLDKYYTRRKKEGQKDFFYPSRTDLTETGLLNIRSKFAAMVNKDTVTKQILKKINGFKFEDPKNQLWVEEQKKEFIALGLKQLNINHMQKKIVKEERIKKAIKLEAGDMEISTGIIALIAAITLPTFLFRKKKQ